MILFGGISEGKTMDDLWSFDFGKRVIKSYIAIVLTYISHGNMEAREDSACSLGPFHGRFCQQTDHFWWR